MTLNLRQSLNSLEKSLILLSGKFSSSWKCPLPYWEASPSKFPCSRLHLHCIRLHTAAPAMSHLLPPMLVALCQCQQMLRRIRHTTQRERFLPVRKVTRQYLGQGYWVPWLDGTSWYSFQTTSLDSLGHTILCCGNPWMKKQFTIPAALCECCRSCAKMRGQAAS